MDYQKGQGHIQPLVPSPEVEIIEVFRGKWPDTSLTSPTSFEFLYQPLAGCLLPSPSEGCRKVMFSDVSVWPQGYGLSDDAV